MLNQIVIIGRLVANPIINEEDGKKISKITIAVPRSYKNEDGIYDTDFIDAILWNGIANNVVEYCHKGDLLGIKGRLESRKEKDKNIMQVVAEKVTFLSSKKEEE